MYIKFIKFIGYMVLINFMNFFMHGIITFWGSIKFE